MEVGSKYETLYKKINTKPSFVVPEITKGTEKGNETFVTY